MSGWHETVSTTHYYYNFLIFYVSDCQKYIVDIFLVDKLIFFLLQSYCKHRQDICEHLCGKTLRREGFNDSGNCWFAAASLWNSSAANGLLLVMEKEADLMVASEVNSFTQNVSSEDNVNISRFSILA